MATPTDDNAADGNLDKYRVRLIWRRYTSVTLVASSYPYLSCKVIWFSKSNSSKNLFTLSKIIIARPPSHCHFLSANHMLLRRLFPACMQPYPLHKKRRPLDVFNLYFSQNEYSLPVLPFSCQCRYSYYQNCVYN